MKWNVGGGYYQPAVIKYKLDSIDLELLRWLNEFYVSPRADFCDYRNNRYVWVSYYKVLRDLAYLRINNSEVVGRRFRRMAKRGVIRSHKVKKGNDRGVRVYYRFGKAYQDLLFAGASTAIGKTERPTDSKVGRSDQPTQKSFMKRSNSDDQPQGNTATNRLKSRSTHRVISQPAEGSVDESSPDGDSSTSEQIQKDCTQDVWKEVFRLVDASAGPSDDSPVKREEGEELLEAICAGLDSLADRKEVVQEKTPNVIQGGEKGKPDE